MSKLYTFLFLVIGFNGIAQIISIPDANFKAKLIANNIDTDNDGEIQLEEALNVTGLYLNSSNISSLEGLENFSNVVTLWCSDNPLTEINLCGTAVSTLFCSDNPNLVAINLKNNVVSDYIWMEPPFPPFWATTLPSLQIICCDAGEMTVAEELFNFPNLTFSSDCDITNCRSLLNTSHPTLSLFVSVYPNPVKNELNVILNNNLETRLINIYNTLGQLVQENVNPNETIDVSALKSGPYFIKVISDKGSASSKFLKE